jgi:hypothetical protein
MSGVVRAACLVPAVLAAHAGSVEGHGSWKGKTLTFRYAYIVTYGSKAYVLLSAADVGEAIRGCRLEYALENHLSYRRAPPGVGYRWPSASVAYDRGFEHGGRHAYCWWPASGGRLDAPLVNRFGDPR